MDRDFVFRKKGIVLDFLIYVLASENTFSNRGIQGFFFQKTPEFYDESIAKNFRSEELIMEDINLYLNTDSEDVKLNMLEEAQNEWQYYYAKEIYDQQSKPSSLGSFTDDYFEYVSRFININDVIKTNKLIEFKTIENIHSVFNNSEINRLLDEINYLGNTIYSEKYGKTVLEGGVSIDEVLLSDYFDEFLSLKKIDPKIFISYYACLCLYLWDQGEILYFNYIRKTRGQFNSPMLGEVSSKFRFVENLIQDNEKLFFQHSFNTPQLDGYFDENLKFNTVIYDSVWNYLNTMSESGLLRYSMINGINPYVFKSFQAEHSLYGVKLKFLNRTLNKKAKDEEDLVLSFQTLKNERKGFISFLSDKNFTNSEIDNILNVLSENRYTELGLTPFNIDRDIYFFRFCYFFYVFDYFIEKENIKFDTINSFSKITKFNTQNSRQTKQQYLKNYLNISNSYQKDYPFATSRTDIFLTEVESMLGISREKLKFIPQSKIY